MTRTLNFVTHIYTVIFIIYALVDKIGCYDNNVEYKTLQLDKNTEIQVDKIVTLETELLTEDIKWMGIIEGLRRDIQHLRHHQVKDRKHIAELESRLQSSKVDLDLKLESNYGDLQSKLLGSYGNLESKLLISHGNLESRLERYHGESIVSIAEVVQIRQLVAENFDKTAIIEDQVNDNSLAIEGLQYFEKEANTELRRFRDYKEKAAKRFHQLENHVDKLVENIEVTEEKFLNITQDFENIQDEQNTFRDLLINLQEHITNTSNTTSQCCKAIHKLTNQIKEYSGFKYHTDATANQNSGNSFQLSNEIEITDFGSGELNDEYLSKLEEDTNKIEHNNKKINAHDNIHQGSGDFVPNVDGSGEFSSGEAEELLPIANLNNYLEKVTFHREIFRRDLTINNLIEQYTNLTQYVDKLETRLTSIQLGNFMQNLQESVINFTQNVITLDQWKLSSNQIVNSTLANQDQIIKLTNMIIDNKDKMADMKWKVSNAELLSNQQFSILRMYVIRLNNTVEDIKEQLAASKIQRPSLYQPGYKPGYYGQQTGFGTGYHSTDDKYGQQSTGSSNNIETLASKMDDIGLQIVFNQNRLANLEIKILNESLYTCRKYNMDAYQDSQLATHEVMIKSNTNSMVLTHELVKELDKAVRTLDGNLRSTARRVRGVALNVDTLRGIIPAMVHMKTEVDNFMYHLPTDCSEYYARGNRQTGVYIVHPITAHRSSQVMCHMVNTSHMTDQLTQNGGWTVIQQRFDGSESFNRNWTEYREGFGSADSEYWIGNDIIYMLTSNKNYSLKMEMVDIHDNHWYALYDNFSVSHPNMKFTLSISGYHGNATDAMEYSDNMGFSTPDKDYDASSTACAYFYEAGWWFKHCQTCNLNGRYNIGFMWYDLDSNEWIRLKSSVMKIKPT